MPNKTIEQSSSTSYDYDKGNFVRFHLRQRLYLFIMILFYGALQTSCWQNEKEYTVVISSMDMDKIVSEKTKTLSAKDDTAAFIRGFEMYWIEKLVNKKFNLQFEGYSLEKLPLPFHFQVKNSKGFPISFDAETAERITSDQLRDFKKRYDDLDTTTPLREKPKARSPEIY